jgi:hypothetical protein
MKPNDARRPLFVKIFANLCILYIIVNKYDEGKTANEEII